MFIYKVLVMRNTLKFLPVCCTMILGNCGYSMDYQQNNFSIYGDTDAIVQAVNQFCQKNKYYHIPDISESYEKYKSLQQIISEEFKEYVSNRIDNNVKISTLTDSESYSAHIRDEYGKLCRHHPIQIDKLADQLLQDNLDFISKYSPDNSKVNCLFLAAWNILFKYLNDSGYKNLSNKIKQLISNIKNQTNIYLSNIFFENYTPRIITLLWEYLDYYLSGFRKYKFYSYISREHDTTFHTIYDIRILTGYSIDEIVEKIMKKYPTIGEELIYKHNDSHTDRLEFQEMIYSLLDEEHKFLMNMNNELMKMDEFCVLIPSMKGDIIAGDFWGNNVHIINKEELDHYKELLLTFENQIDSKINELQDNEFIEKMDQLLEKGCYKKQTIINSITGSRYNQSGDTFICTKKTYERYKKLKKAKQTKEFKGSNQNEIIIPKTNSEINNNQQDNNPYANNQSQNPFIKIENEENKFIPNLSFIKNSNSINDYDKNKNDAELNNDKSKNDNMRRQYHNNDNKKINDKDVLDNSYNYKKQTINYNNLQPFNIDDLNSNSVVQEWGDNMEYSHEVYQEWPVVDEYQENNINNMYGNLPTNINDNVNKIKQDKNKYK